MTCAARKRKVESAMSDRPVLDPFGLAREWVAQWEKAVNEHGSEWLGRPEAAQAMQALSGAAVKAQAAATVATGRMLAAANLPSRADIEALGARLATIEAALARIEARLRDPSAPEPRRPAPRRTRKPPSA